MFRCPVCAEPLAGPEAAGRPEPGSRSWCCGRGHTFDAARDGYVNLLVTHQRRHRQPGDSAAMLRHRRAFLDAGHYRPLAEALGRFAQSGQAVLDAGCGEGYYTRDWPSARSGLRLWAVDIAKPAVRLAARRGHPGASYAVASVYDLPVVDSSIDVVVSIFAPLVSEEFERVLRPGGLAIAVTPAPDHLDGLKARLFGHPDQHPDSSPFERPGAYTRLHLNDSWRIRYQLDLFTPESIADLLGMTPYAWYVSPEARCEVAEAGQLSTTVDFRIWAYRLA